MHMCIEFTFWFWLCRVQIGKSKKAGVDSSGHRLSLESALNHWRNILSAMDKRGMLGYYCLWPALALGSSAACEQPGTSYSNLNRLCKDIFPAQTWTHEFSYELFHFAEVHTAATAQSNLAKPHICMFIHVIIPQTHSVLLGKSRKVIPSLCSLGWKLCCASQKGNTKPHQNDEQKCARPQEHTLHTNLQDQNVEHGAACTLCIHGWKRQSN